ncbi:tumor protein p53-inducible protein 13 isoform X1 [Dendrobates tinctorius]|uniref:tumor protein p53-inducible protein 13 isoform X1 n=1 Tax=Dendrobates tinctorius TaxID=92724 RepID=UPI003CC967F1
MWWLYAVSALLLTRAPPAAGAACEGEPSDILLDLPDEDVYTCPQGYMPPPHQVLPSIASVYQQEISPQVCTDTAIAFTATIPNSGAHRPTWAKYGEYIYCPPQQWVHNLQHHGVAFLYHPCVHPKLKDAIASLARSSIAKHIITPLHTLSRDRPLALAAWCSTLEMSHINRTEIIGWLLDNVHFEQQYEEGSYHHLLIRPSVTATDESSIYLQVLHSRLKKRTVKQRWRRLVLPVTPDAHEPVDNVSHGVYTTLADPQTGEFANNRTSSSSVSATTNIHSSPDPVTPRPPVYVPQDADPESLKADIHSRELDGNHQAEMLELLANHSLPPFLNITLGLSGVTLSHSIRESTTQEVIHHYEKEQLINSEEMQHVDSPKSNQSEGSVSPILLPTPTPQHQSTSTDKQAVSPEKLSTDSEGQKPHCKCLQDTTLQLPAKAQRRLGAGQKKSAGVFVSTPRTEEAKWAAASLIFLFALLIFSVLYTQIYKKFRKGQSLYWTPGSHSEEKESVASIIKRRLVQGHSIRKKWIGRKKNPVLVYERLSDSSD